MVFYGHPSRDCAPCRRRKTRCDLVPTGCSQCRRAKVTCHGYRNPTDLVFRDETRNTVQQALARQSASRLPSAPQWSSDVSSRHAFLSLYAGAYTSAYDNLRSLMADSGHDKHLQLSVDAVGLAFMAFQLNRQDLAPLANQRYLEAIRSLGLVVQSSMQTANSVANQSLSDATLQSVLLLDLFEKLAFNSHQMSEFPGHLLSHIQGALSIVQSIPRTQFSNPMIQQLATQSVLAYTLSCGAEEIPIPEAVVRLYSDLGRYIRTRHWILIGHFIRLINFCSETRNGKSDSSDIRKRVRSLYDELSYAESRMPQSLWPQRRDTSDALAFDNYYDVYPGHRAAQFFNAYRFMRLGAAEMLQKLEYSAEIAEDVTQTTQAICATVPQILLPTETFHNAVPFSPFQMLECAGVLAPLYLAAQQTRDPMMRAWILRTLMYMADNGLKPAKIVAYILKFKPQVGYWAVFRMIGNYAITSSERI